MVEVKGFKALCRIGTAIMSKKQKQRTVYEEKILENARQYARMNAFGHYIDKDGHLVAVGSNDHAMHIEMFRDQMCMYAKMAMTDASAEKDEDGNLVP